MNFCYKTGKIFKLIGIIFLILKVVIPLVIIILASIDLGKAMISNDEKAIPKALSTLLKRFIAGVVIFFIPTIIRATFKMVSSFNDVAEDFNNCFYCITSPYSDSCDTSYNNSLFD